MAASEYVTVTTTTSEESEAARLASDAVTARLAACAQVSMPITSTYWWDGKVESATEFRVDFKTTSALATRLTAYILTSHSYTTPEVLVTPIIGGNPEYLAWLKTETTS